MRDKMETIGEQLGELSICWQPWTSGWSCFLATTRLCPTILENKDALALLSRYRVNLNIGGNTLSLHLSEINRECKKAVGVLFCGIEVHVGLKTPAMGRHTSTWQPHTSNQWVSNWRTMMMIQLCHWVFHPRESIESCHRAMSDLWLEGGFSCQRWLRATYTSHSTQWHNGLGVSAKLHYVIQVSYTNQSAAQCICHTDTAANKQHNTSHATQYNSYS